METLFNYWHTKALVRASSFINEEELVKRFIDGEVEIVEDTKLAGTQITEDIYEIEINARKLTKEDRK